MGKAFQRARGVSRWLGHLLFKYLSLQSTAPYKQDGVTACTPVTAVLEVGLQTDHSSLLAFRTAKLQSS